jgi:hypothetical protein
VNYRMAEMSPADHPHRELRPFIGLKLDAAFILPDGMFFSFEGGRIIQATVSPAIAGDISHGILLKIGDSKPGTDWRALLAGKTPDDPRLDTLRGLPFRGLDNDVFMFGDSFGLQVGRAGLRFVKVQGVRTCVKCGRILGNEPICRCGGRGSEA